MNEFSRWIRRLLQPSKAAGDQARPEHERKGGPRVVSPQTVTIRNMISRHIFATDGSIAAGGGVFFHGPNGKVEQVVRAEDQIHGSGKAVEVVRTVDPFNKIKLYGVGTVRVSRGEHRCAVTVNTTLPAGMENFTTHSENGCLVIRTEGSFVTDVKPIIDVRCPGIEAVKVSGCGTIKLVQVTDKRLRAKVSGQGTIEVEGSVDQLDAEISGSGQIKAIRLMAVTANIELSGAGIVHAHVRERVDVDLSGVGSILIMGNPAHRSVTKSGMGEIEFV